MTAAVELLAISKSFPGVAALTAVDLSLPPGRIHALVGENGAGKSTLINILSGALTPDTGVMRVNGQNAHFKHPAAARAAGIVTVHQEVDLFADLSVAENMGLLAGLPANRVGWIDWGDQRRRTQAALDSVHEPVAPDGLASGLSPAQRQMVEIAAAISQAAHVLVLDEPTSSLSAAESQTLFGHLRRFREQGAAILYVSHRLDEIFALADDITVLRDGQRVWHGLVTETSPADLIQKMVGRPMVARSKDSRRQTAEPVRFRCAGVTTLDGSCTDISLAVRGGEVLGLYGLIGSGRSEWAQAVFGVQPLASGAIYVDDAAVTPTRTGSMVRHGLAYVPEDRLQQGLCRGLTVRANAVLAVLRKLAIGPWLPRSREAGVARRVVERLAVRTQSIQQPVGTLSGGNQQKVILGRWLECDPHILILDEPTRGIDVGAKEEIHALIRDLANGGRAVVFISSDLPEVLANSDRVGIFREGRIVATLAADEATPERIAAAALPGVQPAGAPDKPVAQRTTKQLGKPVQLPREAALFGLIVALAAVLAFSSGGFRSAANLGDLATSTALLGFCAAGVAVVILAGGIDISLGALMALSAAIAGGLWETGLALPLVIVVAILVGAAGGALNAGLTWLGRVHPIVVTLGTMSVYRGLTLWWMQRNILIPGQVRNVLFGEGQVLPPVVWLGAGFLVVMAIILRQTTFGRRLYAVGGNPAAARRVGIRPARVWLAAFTLQGALAGIAGILYLGRSGNLQPTSYEDKTLEAVAAAVVGGVAITGGRGTAIGVGLGCLFLVMLGPTCQFLHISTNWQRTLVGAVLVIAVTVDALWRRRKP